MKRLEPVSLRDAVVAATRRCSTAEVPVGLCLSGGIDSSCLAAALAANGRSLPAYQFRADGEPGAERETAAVVADHTALDLRLVGGGAELLAALPELTAMVGLPLGDPSVLAVYALARRAAADGVRVLLGGEGADELFLGYRRHRVVRWLSYTAPFARLAFVGGRRDADDSLGMGTTHRLFRSIRANCPYENLLEVAPPGFRRQVFEPSVAEGTFPDPGESSPSTALQRAREIDRNYYLRADLLPKLDTALMAAGVEGRSPFLDPEVTGHAIATDFDTCRILGKRHLRAAFRDDLPPGVLDGKKRGFAVPLDRWLREDDFLPDLLRDRRTRERGHLQPGGLLRMLDLHLTGRHRLGHALYLVAAMELHLRDVEGTS